MPEEQLHSQEVHDIMETIPGWIIRWGVSLVFILFVIVLSISYFVKYPEVLSAPITITTTNPPADLIVKSTGRIQKIIVPNEHMVSRDSLVAVLFNTADYFAVLEFEKYLSVEREHWTEYIAHSILKTNYNMGEIQLYYTQFIQVCKSYNYYIETNSISQRQLLLKDQIEKICKNIEIKHNQLRLIQRDIVIEQANLERDSVLYKSKALTGFDYNRSKQNYIQKSLSYIEHESALNTMESNVIGMKEQLLQMSIQYDNDVTQFQLRFEETRDELLAQIKLWKDRYLIVSPIDGVVAYTRYWSENQSVTIGDRLATVVPNDSSYVVGRMIIPSVSLAKIEAGQQVNVKLTGFPYMEFGMLRGRLHTISAVPEAGGYAAEVDFPNGLVSTYKIPFRLIQQMDGTGEVITQDMRLIERFTQPIRSLFNNNIAN